MPAKTTLTAFLSHKYKAPTVNEFFFRLFSQAAEVQFEVDVGTMATNVTRLERLIRDADAFIGIYPFDEGGEPNPTPEKLKESSRYFRLELDLAARAGKPGLVFTDLRYRGVLAGPPPLHQVAFDIQEVLGHGPKPSAARFQQAFREFCGIVRAARQRALAEGQPLNASNLVGVLLPPAACGGDYMRAHIDAVLASLRQALYEPVEMSWPPVITPAWLSRTRGLNAIVLDIGPASAATGVVAFLHGAFLPAFRLRQVATPNGNREPTALESTLYGGVEVGYAKDILNWWDTESLASGLAQKIATVQTLRRRISTADEAYEYFRSAALRKEAVFLSYAGKDLDAAKDLRLAFSRRFQTVFDYRDGQSIRPGQPWLKEIFDRLAASPIGVPLLSPAYVESGNCMHELREMVARADSKRMQIFPLKLRNDSPFEIPAELGSMQYVRVAEYATPDQLIDWIVANLKSGSA